MRRDSAGSAEANGAGEGEGLRELREAFHLESQQEEGELAKRRLHPVPGPDGEHASRSTESCHIGCGSEQQLPSWLRHSAEKLAATVGAAAVTPPGSNTRAEARRQEEKEVGEPGGPVRCYWKRLLHPGRRHAPSPDLKHRIQFA